MTNSTRAPSHPRRRANGEGSIYSFRGRWRAAFTWIAPDGTRQRKVISATTQAEARDALGRMRADVDRGAAPAATATVADFLTGWLDGNQHRIRPATRRAYGQAVALYLIPALGTIRLSRLTPTHVEQMTARLIEAGKSPRTAHTARAVLRTALQTALRDGQVTRNVADLARAPRVPQQSMERGRDYLDPAQVRQLITASTDHPLGPLVTLAATTGLRLGELLGLSWDDIGNRQLTVRRALARADGETWALAEPKTQRSRRTINLPGAAVAALDRQRERQEAARAAVGTAWQDQHGLIFTDGLGRPLRPDDVNHAWHRVLDAAGLPSIPFHGLRHSAATALLSAGVPLKVVADQLGHSTIVLTANTYAAVVPELRREAADAMDRVLAG